MFTAYMWCYPWDLIDEGIDEALDRIQETGVNGICLATTYHSIEHLRMHEAFAGRERTYVYSGAAYFQPRLNRYKRTPLVPLVPGWLDERNPPGEIAAACEQRGLSMRSWTVCCHNSEMVSAWPDVGMRNVFGDINPTWMCPLNPDVGEYMRALVEELSSQYAFEAIELESPAFNPARHYHTHIKMGLPPGKVEEFLLNLCFCESCRHGARDAGIDVDQAADAVRTELERWFRTTEPNRGSLDEILDATPGLRAFVRWRIDAVADYLRRIKGTCTCDLVVYAERDVLTSALDLAAFRDEVDLAMLPCYSKADPVEPTDIEDAANWLSRQMAGPERTSIGLMTYPPAAPDAPTLARQVHRLAELGVRTVHLYHHGIMPGACLKWTQQALRKPRREG